MKLRSELNRLSITNNLEVLRERLVFTNFSSYLHKSIFPPRLLRELGRRKQVGSMTSLIMITTIPMIIISTSLNYNEDKDNQDTDAG